jgi:hypothetical protein
MSSHNDSFVASGNSPTQSKPDSDYPTNQELDKRLDMSDLQQCCNPARNGIALCNHAGSLSHSL